jgi:alkylhydroperoxidase family enzyme
MPDVAWIATVDEADARDDLVAAYAAHILKIHSLNPRSMLAHRALYRTLMFGPSPLKRYQREMISTLVSVLNDCHY